MIQLKTLADEEDPGEGGAPPLVTVTELVHTSRDWVVIYHFFLGPLDGHFPMYLGRLSDVSEKDAKAKARDQTSPLLGQAWLALLRAVQLETMH